ncbi:MAG: leucyl aminopeptidase [Desulfoarculaceae bacterium]|nr:leucyl aminopeptidase [Desulfoarculaceae bacterium]
MKSTKVIVTEKKPEQFSGDLLVYCVEQPKKGALKCDSSIVSSWLEQSGTLEEFRAKEGELLLFYPRIEKESVSFSARRLLLVGLGKIEGNEAHDELRERCRLTGGLIAQQAGKVKAKKIMICLPEIMGIPAKEVAECMSEGVLLGDYRFLKYKKNAPEEELYQGLEEIRLFARASTDALHKAVRMGQIAALAAREARNMANEPGNCWTPSHFATHGRMLAKKYSLKCTVLGKDEMKRMGMGGILAVNQGSTEPPKMVVLEYRPIHKTQTLLLVGKGLTFDSGGVSLKPGAGMEDMKYDMCGGAAVMALMQAVGEERPDLGIVAIVPATENMAGGAALKPGDIITHYNGLTSEIVNTDAEGRLILADALAFGLEKFKPDYVIDLATLTGAAIIALGHHRTALLGNNDELVECLLAAGDRSGEPLWRLPLGKEYTKQLESRVADMKNTGGKSAGTITAAAYLEKFVGDTPWAHLDIAGTAWEFTEKSYVPRGPSGIGARTLLELVRRWKKEEKTVIVQRK